MKQKLHAWAFCYNCGFFWGGEGGKSTVHYLLTEV